MKPSGRTLATLALLGTLSALALVRQAAPTQARAPEEKADLKAPQSPAKPAPKWLKLVDLGAQDARLKGYTAPEGVKVEVVAEAPVVVNPVGMAFGDDGTPYVLEWRPSKVPGDEWRETPVTFKYKDGTTRKVATMKKGVKDVVKALADSKGKGKYDKAAVVLEDELPSSILLHDGWIYLSGRGTVRRYKQSKAGGPYDKVEVIAQGFCGFHHHQVSGMTVGNDGWLYLTSGDDDNFVEGSDGSRATVLRTGAVFRCKPDGSRMHTYALGFRNPYRDVAFDVVYNMFHVDNDNEDGSKFMGCRLLHVPEGSDFGWRLFTGARCCRPDHARGAAFGELPGKVPPLLKTGRGAPAGLLIYNETRFPENYRGLLFYPDAYRQLIRAYRVEPRGAGFAVVEEFEFLKSADPLFRPCQMLVGPDGAMYVVDWRTNSGGAGKLWGDGTHGRVYRLTWAGTDDEPALKPRPLDSWARFAKMGDADLIGALRSEDFSDRERARKELARRGPKSRATLIKLLLDEEAFAEARVAALGALGAFYNTDVQKAFLKVLRAGDVDLRRLAADGLALNAAKGDKDVGAALLEALADEDLALKRAVAVAMGRVAAPGAADSLASALSFDDGKDVFLTDGLVRALEALGKPGVDALLALADSGVKKDSDRVVETFRALRTKPGFDALPALLKNPHLSDAQRADLVRSCGNYLLDPPVALDPVVAYLAGRPKEVAAVKLAGLEVLATPGVVPGAKAGDWVLAQLDDKDAGVRLAALQALAPSGAKAGPRLAKKLGEKDLPAAQRLAALQGLRHFKEPTAVKPLQALLADDKAASPEALAVKREALVTLAAIDADKAAASAKAFLGSKDAALQAEAVGVLGTTAEGARHVGALFLAEKLPRALLPQVSEGLRKHAGKDAEAAKLLSRVLKSGLLLKNTPDEVARLTALVKAKGDARRGRAVYLNAKTVACVTCHRLEGVGGNVGPDLTRLWDTHAIDKVLEALIDPDKEIKEGYQTYQATTKKGMVYQGLKVSQTPTEVVLREATGRDVRLRVKELEELKPLKASLMPDNVVSQLSFAEFLDLVAFLKDQKAQESLRGLALDFWVAGPFGAGLKEAYAPEAKADPAATYPGGKSWQPAAAGPTGLLDLRGVFKADKASAYALTYVYSPKAQKADLLLGADDTVRVWVGGKLVHEHATPRRAAPDDDAVKVALKEGWNPVLVKVVNVDGDHGLYLRFAGEGLRVARTPAEK